MFFADATILFLKLNVTGEPVELLAQLVTGLITHAGIALAEAPARKRKKIRNELQIAMHQLMAGLRQPTK